MQEALLQFAWKMQLFNAASLVTTDGEPVSIVHRGDPNTHSGPDFLHARIRIGDTLWVGNIEVHVNSSGWLSHRHHTDRAYDNVILHVVYEHDMPHSEIPTLALQGRIADDLLQGWQRLMTTASWVPCARHLDKVPPVVVYQLLDRLLAERLEEKAVRIEQRLHINSMDWEETTYQWIARGFGTQVNADPFERVARSLPLKILLKHHDQPTQIEALLFGQAGMLEGNFRAVYAHRLKAEYTFLQKKYQLEPIRSLEWKFLRMRPANFPTVRMSQLAALITARRKLFSHLLEVYTLKDVQRLFDVEAGAFWQEHYHFKKASRKATGHIGADLVQLQVINTFAPLLFLYGRLQDDQRYITRALDLLEQTPPEDNAIIRQWASLGVTARHAGHTQALLQLKQQHCVHKRCLECAIGYRVLQTDGM